MITTKNGLLYDDGRELGCVEADEVARNSGFQFQCAEELVRHLEEKQKNPQNLLAVFDPIASDIARFAVENRLCVFNYEDPKGNQLARSHCYKLRCEIGRASCRERVFRAV